MPNNASAVAIGKPAVTGGALRAPLGTALPADATTVLTAAFKAVGYISSDGVVESTSTDTNDIVAWGGDTVRTVQTSHAVTYAFTMIETNPDSVAVYYGDDNVTATVGDATKGAELAIRVTSEELTHQVWDFEIMDGIRKGRVVLPDGQVTERGDVSYIDEDAVSYPVTVSAYPDADGVKAYIYWNDGKLVTGLAADDSPAVAVDGAEPEPVATEPVPAA